jgi:DNA-binding NarL/FixJ family response regulator
VIRILIADDHPIVRLGLKELLVRDLKGAVCGEAANGQQIVFEIQRHDWDLVILDVTMPGRSGFDVLKDIQGLRPKLPVLVVSAHSEEQLGKRALKAGASGYLNKESAPEELAKAIQKVLAGGRYVSPALAEQLALDLGGKGEGFLHDRLSDRELEVLQRMASGKTISQIAEDLHLAVPTIRTYRARILEKLELTSTTDLVRYAMDNKLWIE